MSASDRKDYAVSIFKWCRANPTKTIEDFLAMIDRVETQILAEWEQQAQLDINGQSGKSGGIAVQATI